MMSIVGKLVVLCLLIWAMTEGMKTLGKLPRTETINITTSQAPLVIDILFTGALVMQLIEVKNKSAISFWSFGSVDRPSGYCYHVYEIGLGYQQLTKTQLSKSLDAACAGDDYRLPKPGIISVNSISSEHRGEYARAECEQWDAKPTIRESKIKGKLAGERWNHIEKTGQRILGTYLRLYCGSRRV